MERYILDEPCSKCGKTVYGYRNSGIVWCSSYGDIAPYENDDYPEACGYRIMCG